PLLLLFVVCSMTRPPRTSPLFPYTTLFRSGRPRILDAAAEHAVADVEEHAQADGNPLAGELGDRLPITQFTRERVPVGLGVLLDISDSMFGRRIEDARTARSEERRVGKERRCPWWTGHGTDHE